MRDENGQIKQEYLMRDTEFLMELSKAGIDPAQLSEEELEAVYIDYEGQRETINKQRLQAENMRQQSSAGMGGTQAGNVFVADGAGEAIASMMGNYANVRKQRGFDEQEADLSAKNALGRQSMAEAYSNALRGNAPPQPSGGQAGVVTPEELERLRRQQQGGGFA